MLSPTSYRDERGVLVPQVRLFVNGAFVPDGRYGRIRMISHSLPTIPRPSRAVAADRCTCLADLQRVSQTSTRLGASIVRTCQLFSNVADFSRIETRVELSHIRCRCTDMRIFTQFGIIEFTGQIRPRLATEVTRA